MPCYHQRECEARPADETGAWGPGQGYRGKHRGMADSSESITGENGPLQHSQGRSACKGEAPTAKGRMVARTQQETGKMTGRIREKASREEDEKKHLQHSHDAGKRTQPEYEVRTAEARKDGPSTAGDGEKTRGTVRGSTAAADRTGESEEEPPRSICSIGTYATQPRGRGSDRRGSHTSKHGLMS